MPEENKPIDETVPGGKYIVNGQFVNAEGEPIVGEKPTKEDMAVDSQYTPATATKQPDVKK